MDRNHALNFDQYDEMKASGDLDWQKKKLEEQITLKTVKKQTRHELER